MKNDNILIKNAWDSWSDDYYANALTEVEQLIKAPNKAFPTKVWDYLNYRFPSFKNLKICVPSSGDNNAVFAFHLLGAQVTSCDISHKQINNAKQIANKYGWNIDFKVLDSMNLSSFDSEVYDIVYTSNGVHVWISDLVTMYSGFNRILKKGGSYIFFETHPFIRPFDDSTDEIKIAKPYSEIHVIGDVSNYHWRVQDFVNSIISSGLTIKSMYELSAEKDNVGARWWGISEWDTKSDYRINPYAALPTWISFCTVK